MIHFICALRCEAVPLIEHYELKYLPKSTLFSIYYNERKSVSLTVTGVGKLASAAAVIYTSTSIDCKPTDVWLNAGIAGHRERDIGRLYLAQKIEDAGSDAVWYPQIIIDTTVPTENLVTLDRPSTDYIDAMFDMEASGFVSSACRLGSMELIHSVKIISDNMEYQPVKMDEKSISKLVRTNRPELVDLSWQLESLSNELKSNIDITDNLQSLLDQWHFTQYQKTRLEYLLNRWQLIFPGLSPATSITGSCNNAATVMEVMRKKMDDESFFLAGNNKSD